MNNRSSLLLAGALAVASIVEAQPKPFSIEGKITGKTGVYIYLMHDSGIDSTLIENGSFSFKGQLDGPVQGAVMMDKSSDFFDKYAELYLSPGKMDLSLDYNNFEGGAKLKGSPVQAEADRLKKSKESIMIKLRPLSEAYSKANGTYIEAIKSKKDEVTLKQLKEKATSAKDAMEPYTRQLDQIDKAFMDKNPGSFVTASLLRYKIIHMPLQEGEKRYSRLPEQIKNGNLGKQLKETLDRMRGGAPGAQAFMFTSTELRGEQLSLADYKGKYVLIDFWASWCVPCRKGNPHLLSLYSKYKNKGLEIIGVSDDDSNHGAWKKAIEEDNIGVWKHVLRGLKKTADGNYDRTASISDKYGISTLPTKILVDPNGMIIGRYGGGGENDEAMDKKLSDIFGG